MNVYAVHITKQKHLLPIPFLPLHQTKFDIVCVCFLLSRLLFEIIWNLEKGQNNTKNSLPRFSSCGRMSKELRQS